MLLILILSILNDYIYIYIYMFLIMIKSKVVHFIIIRVIFNFNIKSKNIYFKSQKKNLEYKFSN